MEKIDNIGLDMDGVIVDLQLYQFLKGIPYFMKKLQRETSKIIVDENAYDIQHIFEVTHKERMEFWAKNIWEYSLLFPAREGVSEMTHKWHDEGRIVDIITSRVYVDRNDPLGALFRKMTKIYLYTQNIYYDKIMFCSEKNSGESKASACKELNTKLLVDDKIVNLEAIRNQLLGLCFTANWNKNFEVNQFAIARIKSFYEIDDFIQNYENHNLENDYEKKKKFII